MMKNIKKKLSWCPFLTGRYVFSCRISKDVYVPNMFEIEEYCRTRRHTMCPFYYRYESSIEDRDNKNSELVFSSNNETA